MIENGNKVQYIGIASKAYTRLSKETLNSEGKIGTVVSDPYQLPAVPNTLFVEVKWDGESKPASEFANWKAGHVVNVNNLRVIG